MAILKSFGALKGYLLFWLTFCCMTTVGLFAYYKSDRSALDVLPILLGIYAGSSFGKQASAHWASSRDANSNTQQVIESINEK